MRAGVRSVISIPVAQMLTESFWSTVSISRLEPSIWTARESSYKFGIPLAKSVSEPSQQVCIAILSISKFELGEGIHGQLSYYYFFFFFQFDSVLPWGYGYSPGV
jgi:hypothetical protein